MPASRPVLSAVLLILAYGVTASLTIGLTRFDGGVAFLWVASSLLIADLMVRPRAQWPTVVAGCAVASALATGLFGFGWLTALPFAVVNMAEAVIAAWLFKRYHDPRTPLGSLPWVFHLVLTVGIVAPIVSGSVAAVIVAFNGAPLISNFIHFYDIDFLTLCVVKNNLLSWFIKQLFTQLVKCNVTPQSGCPFH